MSRLWEEWEQYRQSQSSRYNRRQRKSTPPINHSLEHFYDAEFTKRRHLAVKTTTLHRVSSKDCAARRPPWFVAAVTGDAGNPQLLHPLTLKSHRCYLPQNFNLSNFSYFRTSVVSFHTTEFNFDKIFIPLSRAKVLSENTMFVLLGGGNLIGRPYLVESEHSPPPWFKLSDDMFDDIVEGKDEKTYALDRLGKLHLILNNVVSRVLRFNTKIDSQPLEGVSGRVGWRKRLVVYSGELYSVVREEEKVFRVYKFVKRNCSRLSSDYCWNEIKEFHWREVLFVSKDVFFFTSEFGGKEYEGCIVFSESSFPRYGDNGWEYKDEDGVRVYRMSDGRYGSVGESAEFPEIDWSVPSWVLDEGSHSSLHPHSQIVGYDRQPEEDNKGAKSDSKESNSKDEEEEQEVMDLDSDSHDQNQEGGSDSGVQVLESGKLQCELNSHETEDEEMHCNADIDEDAVLEEVVPPSILASVSAVEEEVTHTLFPMNGGNEATEEDTSRTNIAPSALKPSTLSTSKSCQNDSATAKFEGFDVRTDVVPTLQKIWRNHGSIIENSSIGNRDIIGKALESLATMVLTLENNPIQSLNDDQVDYLSTTLSDLKIMSFKVHWLSSLVDKVVKLHKSKALVDSLNKLGQLTTHVQERKASLVSELSKLTEKENKLKEEMAKVSNLIPFSGQVKFDEPLGSGLT